MEVHQFSLRILKPVALELSKNNKLEKNNTATGLKLPWTGCTNRIVNKKIYLFPTFFVKEPRRSLSILHGRSYLYHSTRSRLDPF